MDINKVRDLIKLLEKSGISELEIHEGQESVRISRYPSKASQQFLSPAPESFVAAPPSPINANPSLEKTNDAPSVNSSDKTLNAPMVGTFYRAPSPNDKAFVEVGQKVKTGDVLCIIEAMKMLNQIQSEHSGTVKRILVENGQPIEFGQPLFIISEA